MQRWFIPRWKRPEVLSKDGIDVEILDLRTVSPLDREAITQTVKKDK